MQGLEDSINNTLNEAALTGKSVTVVAIHYWLEQICMVGNKRAHIMAKILPHIKLLWNRLSPGYVVVVLRATCKVKSCDAELLRMISTRINTDHAFMSIEQLVNAMYYLSLLKYCDVTFLTLCDELELRLDTNLITSGHIAKTWKSMATLNIKHKALIRILTQNKPELNTYQAICVMWSCAVLNVCNTDWNYLLANTKDITCDVAPMIWQVYYWVHYVSGLDIMFNPMIKYEPQPWLTNKLQEEVINSLHKITDVKTGVYLQGIYVGIMCGDTIVLPTIATDYLWKSNRLTGRSVLKHNILEALAPTTIVPYFDWPGTVSDQLGYLRELLKL